MIPPVIHIVTGIMLTAAHAVFFFRGLRMRQTGRGPAALDRAARLISHIGLPLAVATGFLAGNDAESRYEPYYALHVLLGILPILTILAFTPFLAFRRRLPWLLPLVNLILLSAAMMTGTAAGR